MELSQSIKRAVSRLVGSGLLDWAGKPMLHATQFVLGLRQREVVNMAQPIRAAAVARVREIVTGLPTQTIGVDEAYMLRNAVLATSAVPGALAEVGVFRGCTARVICEAKSDRPLHLFDTFAGLPAPGEHDTDLAEGQYACDLAFVKAYLSDFSGVHYHRGTFPATATAVSDLHFSLVHLDVDLYESTLAGLRFFYPRMSRGAMLISHDYVEFPGVRRAFEQYFEKSSQPVLELTGNQCLVVKALD